MKTLENNEFNVKQAGINSIKIFFFALAIGLLLLYFSSFNPYSTTYINDIPFYVILILIFIIILYLIRLFRTLKIEHAEFKVSINEDTLILEQSSEPKQTIIKMKKVEKIIQTKSGYISFFKEQDEESDGKLINSFNIYTKVLKEEEELIQYLSCYREVELEEDGKKKFTIRETVGVSTIIGTFLLFFIINNIYFTIPMSALIMLFSYRSFKDNEDIDFVKFIKINIIYISLFIFALVKFGFAIWYIFS